MKIDQSTVVDIISSLISTDIGISITNRTNRKSQIIFFCVTINIAYFHTVRHALICCWSIVVCFHNSNLRPVDQNNEFRWATTVEGPRNTQ